MHLQKITICQRGRFCTSPIFKTSMKRKTNTGYCWMRSCSINPVVVKQKTDNKYILKRKTGRKFINSFNNIGNLKFESYIDFVFKAEV
jgi:hypothetical protein